METRMERPYQDRRKYKRPRTMTITWDQEMVDQLTAYRNRHRQRLKSKRSTRPMPTSDALLRGFLLLLEQESS
jgi:hypothetical protein